MTMHDMTGPLLLLQEALGLVGGDKLKDVDRDIKDLRAALKALVGLLRVANDEEKDLLARQRRLQKQRERLQLKQSKTIRDLYTMSRGRERMKA